MVKKDLGARCIGLNLALVSAAVMLSIVAALAVLRHPSMTSSPDLRARNEALGKYLGMPLYFERNLGQTDPAVRYLSRTTRSAFYLTDNATVITLVGGSVRKSPPDLASTPTSARD